MKKAAIIILAISLVKVLSDLAVRSEMWYLPLLWIIVLIIPVLYLLVAKAAKHNLVYLLAYAILTLLIIILGQAVFNLVWGVESDTYLLYSSSFLIFAQLGLWVQYYYTRHKAPADALSLGIEFSPEKSASIRALITNGRMEEAVEQLTAGEELNQEQKVIVTNFAYRFSKVTEQQALGLLTTEEVTVEKNKIVTGLLRYV